MDLTVIAELVMLSLVMIFAPAAVSIGCWLAKVWRS